jgi:hypothetical protein
MGVSRILCSLGLFALKATGAAPELACGAPVCPGFGTRRMHLHRGIYSAAARVYGVAHHVRQRHA